MALITKEEVIKLAHISNIKLKEEDIAKVVKDINDVLEYASFLKDVASNHKVTDVIQNINVMREDNVIKTDPQTVLNLAPEVQENYFVVPKIIERKSHE